MKILVLNCGSSSVKFDLWETSPEAISANSDKLTTRGTIERISNIDEALRTVFAKLGDMPVEAVGHRIVHGGDKYHASVLIDAEVERDIEILGDLAPLHNPHNLAGVRAARQHLPGASHVAVFDTAFHHTLPRVAYAYGLPYEYLTEKKIRRYGFHGISHRYVSWRFADLHGKKRGDYRLITCHLGNGCSACAIEYGKSMDTSMGFTPLEGLVMGTRAGDVDAGAILHLITHEKEEPRRVLKMLNNDSGLQGISGVSNDMRDVRKSAAAGDERSQLAVDMFCYRVRKYIGAYLAAMDGADALIFTGGIGENSPEIRAQICGKMGSLGIALDPAANSVKSDDDRQIGTGNVPVWVVPTQEELLIARDTVRCVLGIPHE
ncbi:MAG: acetate kinase [Acidobacteriota bacterium]